ncbi:DUF871 domain-containing protein [Liquorilactobacillus oeni]|uniref:Outer surface protein n=1 Tax=Liquorilactobacillus oeni DSM 19972 TaxID=1423777 RepID=A0A0R1MF18_9LACO|nr:MupG family TIM beta-alpha barrel fold protein [Liquorilactobacillus oeni]KRL04500.1 outer surface protein [Liquorilactobacillus oeni DSM 19972]
MEYGFSVYLDHALTSNSGIYIKQMSKMGFSGIFTSIHLPEDKVVNYRERLFQLAALARENHLKLMVDIACDSLEKIGLSLSDPQRLSDLGITGLRLDEHLSPAIINRLSSKLKIGLNASTLTQAEIEELHSAGTDFSKLEAWHNYYPRPETGLEKSWFTRKNHWLQRAGLKVQAFVPGDEKMRAPLFKGLPTLEEHRSIHPLAAALDLFKLGVSCVYVGDPQIKESTQKQFAAFIQESCLTFQVKQVIPNSRWFDYVLGIHQNRFDPARDVIRCADSRMHAVPLIAKEIQQQQHKRKIGSVTLDNKEYLRYMGEIELCLTDLPADEKVNTAGQINARDCDLLQHLEPGAKFKLVKMQKERNS